IASRGNAVTIKGRFKDQQTAEIVLDLLWHKLKKNQEVTISEVDAAVRFARGEKEELTRDDGRMKAEHYARENFFEEKAAVRTGRSRLINPRGPNQAAYIDMMRQKDMVFGIGPAG